MKKSTLKKGAFVAICILGLACFSACRSTSQSCGLAMQASPNQTTLNQMNLV